MQHRHIMEAVDCTFQDICDSDKPFGGYTVVFSVGDPHCSCSMAWISHARSGPYIDIPLPLIDVLFVL